MASNQIRTVKDKQLSSETKKAGRRAGGTGAGRRGEKGTPGLFFEQHSLPLELHEEFAYKQIQLMREFRISRFDAKKT